MRRSITYTGLLLLASLILGAGAEAGVELDEYDRVYRAYPHLHDDPFVTQHLDEWMR